MDSPAFKIDFFDSGVWFVEHTATGSSFTVGARVDALLSLAAIRGSDDPDARFKLIAREYFVPHDSDHNFDEDNTAFVKGFASFHAGDTCRCPFAPGDDASAWWQGWHTAESES